MAAATGAATRLGTGPKEPAVVRLDAALSAFTGGARVRRTVVLVAGDDRAVSATTMDYLRQRLAASGTALYVIDLTSGGTAPLDELAAANGGFAVRAGRDAATPGVLAQAADQLGSELASQFYLRFPEQAARPAAVRVTLSDPGGDGSTVVALPATNPTSLARPPQLVQPVEVGRPIWDRVLVWLAVALVASSLLYGIVMLVASRREPRSAGRSATLIGTGAGQVPVPAEDRAAAPDELFFVFVLPCLNEERVILASLQRLLDVPGDNFAVLVVDDASDDATAAVVSEVAGDRIWLLRRYAPDARKGKGEALNAAVEHLVSAPLLRGRDLDHVVLAVVDADGRLEPEAVAAVTPFFDDPTVGGVQIGVRINNRHQSWLARLQDMEFVIYTEVFQRGRRHVGSVGLGGNGQFMRLSALLSLGLSPWSRSLTEDLDLGVRLLALGWRNEFCSSAAVHQQGVVQFGRLIRQRTRWFQGHLQSWRLVPVVVRSVPRWARGDLLYHLSSPVLLLIASLLTGSFLVSLLATALLALQGHNPLGTWVLTTYALSFGPSLAYSYVYWLRERQNGFTVAKCLLWAHCYVLYGLIWYAAGWWAVVRTVRGSTGWAKTERTVEVPAAAEPVGIS